MFTDALPDFSVDFLRPRIGSVPKRRSEEEKVVKKKPGPRETGYSTGFKPYKGWQGDDGDWLEEKRSSHLSVSKNAHTDISIVPKKPGPRETGWKDDFVPYNGWESDNRDWLAEKLHPAPTSKKVERKPGPREVGRNDRFQPYVPKPSKSETKDPEERGHRRKHTRDPSKSFSSSLARTRALSC